MIAILVSADDRDPLFGSWTFKGGVIGFYLVGALVLYFTLLQLKRVEFDREYLYVTNYFKTVRYLLQDIDHISETNLAVVHLGHVWLKAPGIFGRRITFLQSRQKFEDFIKSDPSMASLLKEEQ